MLYKALPSMMGLDAISIPEMWGDKRMKCEGGMLGSDLAAHKPDDHGQNT